MCSLKDDFQFAAYHATWSPNGVRKKRMGVASKFQSLFIALAAAIPLASSLACQSLSSKNETIIERSEMDRPAWTEQPATLDHGKEVFAVVKKAQVYKLDLGIRQAQAAAVQNTRELFSERLQRELRDILKQDDHKDISAATQSNLSQAVQETLQEFTPVDGVLRNIYWENIRQETVDGTRFHYDIWVLLGISRSDLNEVLSMIAQKLQASSGEQTRNIGNTIVKVLSKI